MPLPIPPIRAVPPSEATPGYNDTSITYWAKTRSIIRTPATVLVLLLLCLHLIQRAEGKESILVKPMADGRLVMLPWNKQGDKIPDFSFCGYQNGGVKIPDVPTSVTLEPSGAEDESARIQAALDELGKSLEKTPGGRGALLLKKGLWKINKPLTMSYSGVVLRGEGDGEKGTVLLATMKWVFFLIDVKSPKPDPAWPGTPPSTHIIDQTYIPVGSTRFNILKDGDNRYAKVPEKDSLIKNLKPGDGILIFKPKNAAWVKDLGMDIYKYWSPYAHFERKIVSISNGELVFDVPLPQSLDEKYGGGLVIPGPPDFRIRECGIENLRFDSTYDASIRMKFKKDEPNDYPSDENHCAYAIAFGKIENAWARNCTATHMQHGFVMVKKYARNITIQDCKSLDPVSQIAGGRRYSYLLADLAGPSILMQRCYSRNGRHDFMTQAMTTGPNAFVDCSAESAWDASENHQTWAMGTLYDNVRVTGPRSGLVSANRGRWGGNGGPDTTGHGWSGNTTVFWNCASPVIFALQPPLGQNFMIGCSDPKLYDPVRAKATVSNQNNASGRKDELCEGALQGTAWKESPNESVTPRSLYYAQLQARLGKTAVENVTTAEQRQRR